MNRSLIRWALLSAILLSFSAASFGQVAVGISVRIGPPALPVYAQPICPGPGYFWTPGYWAWSDDDGYYWVPGTWVVAPVGMLWTPGWWGWGDGVYVWHAGYWGPHVGFYGGINYGFGYTGVGFAGGEWHGRDFYYNRSVTNVSVTNVTNVYNRTVVVNNESHVAFNGGTGGVQARPTPQEESYAHEQHTAPLAAQVEHARAASQERANFARENHGRPAVAATARPADFSSRSAVPARAAGAPYHPPAMSPKEARVASNGANRPSSENRGNSNSGFRPFTPPSKSGGNTGANSHNAMPPKGGNNGGNARGGNSNGGFRPFTPPSKGGNANTARGGEPNPGPRNANYNRGTQTRNTESRPQSQPHEASRSNPNPPRENNSRPSAPPKRQAPAPKEEGRHGR